MPGSRPSFCDPSITGAKSGGKEEEGSELTAQQSGPAVGKSGYRGVKENKEGKFMARISHAGRKEDLGTFPTADAAAEAYNVKAKQYGKPLNVVGSPAPPTSASSSSSTTTPTTTPPTKRKSPGAAQAKAKGSDNGASSSSEEEEEQEDESEEDEEEEDNDEHEDKVRVSVPGDNEQWRDVARKSPFFDV